MPLKLDREEHVAKTVCDMHGYKHFVDEFCPECAEVIADWMVTEFVEWEPPEESSNG